MARRKAIPSCRVFGCMIAFGTIALAAQSGMLAPPGQSARPRITCEELKELIDTRATQDIVIVDNQPAESFDEGRIPKRKGLQVPDFHG